MRSGTLADTCLAKLVASAMLRLLQAGAKSEILLHVPAPLAGTMRRQHSFLESILPESVYLISERKSATDEITVSKLGDLRQRHPWKNQMIMVALGEIAQGLVIARPDHDAARIRVDSSSWQAEVSFTSDGALEGVERLRRELGSRDAGVNPVAKWLDQACSRIEAIQAGNAAGQPLWGGCLEDFIFEIEQQLQLSQSKLQALQMVSKVQNAVGWELNAGDLFASVAEVLMRTIGYHYLEIQVLEPRAKDYEVTAVHHHNETSYGGPLLTVILKPAAQSEIVKGKKPIVITPEQAQQYLMNHRLMGLMGFKSGIFIPLVFRQRPNGLLKLFSQHEHHYSTDSIPTLEAIGRVLGRTIENVKNHTLLRRMATVDGLTNLMNRRSFMEQLSREFKRARRYHNNLALIMADIDDFKSFNDTFGHLRGDQILATIGSVLKMNVREVDMPARYGGEEFTVILPEANLEQGYIVAEKIRQAVESYPFKFNLKKIPTGRISVSLGISTLTSKVDNITELINHADMAMYRAKREGKNRTATYGV